MLSPVPFPFPSIMAPLSPAPQKGALRDAIFLGIVQSQRSHIRFKCTFPYGTRDGEDFSSSSVKEFLNCLSSELQKWEGQKNEMISFGVDITFLYCRGGDGCFDATAIKRFQLEVARAIEEELAIVIFTETGVAKIALDIST